MDVPYALDYKLNNALDDNLDYFFQQKMVFDKSDNDKSDNDKSDKSDNDKSDKSDNDKPKKQTKMINKNTEIFTVFKTLNLNKK